MRRLGVMLPVLGAVKMRWGEYIISNLLKSVMKVPGASGKEGMAIVQARKRKSGNKELRWLEQSGNGLYSP